MSLPWVWGATPAEHARRFPADDLLAGLTDGPVLRMTRAVDVAAPVDLAWRWLCQIALAPYSYDLIDNLGRRSPPALVPGADDLRVGQLMNVFRLTGFQAGQQWTGIVQPQRLTVLGPVAVTYAVDPAGANGPARLVARLVVPGRTTAERVRAAALAWGDLPMMRRQLRTLAAYAERDAARS